MKWVTLSNIRAIVFDIDGTLYPTWRFTLRALPFFIKNLRFMYAFSKIRKQLHQMSMDDPEKIVPDFLRYQSELMAERLKIDTSDAAEFLDKYVYNGWKQYFLRVKPYPYMQEAVRQLKHKGYKIGILSDFPPEQKESVWGILEFCDASIGSETLGALKPSRIPFIRIAELLDEKPEHILYVGNSPVYDVTGAAGAGMRTACIQHPLFSFLKINTTGADISFSNYRHFLKSVL